MPGKISSIKSKVLQNITPSKEDIEKIKIGILDFTKKVENRIKENKIKAEIFVGGSYAKNTIIKKDKYDIDVFIRYEQDETADISELTKKILSDFSFEVVHGSRDYFNIKIDEETYLEVVPVKKVKKPDSAENITDLSYFHVKYMNKKIKSKKVLDEIKIAKAFCYARNCYGAESYIGGFSGYALELLIYYYKSFEKFLKEIVKSKEKIIIDIEKHYKSKKQIMMDINSSKLHSPIVLIDPTYKQRNALAALSPETFEKFKKEAIHFLKSPSIELFEHEKTDLDKIKRDADKEKYEFILLESDTNRQPGDIAGSKLLKFYRHLRDEIGVYFDIKNKGFNYNKDKTSRYFFVVKSKGDIILDGPSLKDEENLLKFRKKHSNVFTRNKKIHAREKVDFSLKEFIENWKTKNIERMKEMYIDDLRII